MQFSASPRQPNKEDLADSTKSRATLLGCSNFALLFFWHRRRRHTNRRSRRLKSDTFNVSTNFARAKKLLKPARKKVHYFAPKPSKCIQARQFNLNKLNRLSQLVIGDFSAHTSKFANQSLSFSALLESNQYRIELSPLAKLNARNSHKWPTTQQMESRSE